jgi:hypothetical protein
MPIRSDHDLDLADYILKSNSIKLICEKNLKSIKKCVAYPQEDFQFIKLITSLRISLLNNCKKDFQFHTESSFFTLNIRFFLHDLFEFHVFGLS